jgi:CubicO group peptidase (beta-lactamase class C family)
MKIRILVVILLSLGTIFIWKLKYISNAPDLLTGFSSKIGCSLRFVSQYPEKQVRKDLLNYSSLIEYVDMDFDTAKQSVTSRFLWVEKKSVYKESSGCTLVVANNNNNQIAIRTLHRAPSKPELKSNLSDTVNTLVYELIEQDNKLGHDTRAVLILKNGEVIAEKYAEGYSEGTLFLGWSIAKTLNALIIGNMIKNEMIDFEEKNILKVSKNDPREKITIEQLLTMTSGLDFHEDYSPGGDAVKMLFGDYSAHQRPMKSVLKYNPGEFFSYSSGSANLLSHIIFSRFPSNKEAFSYIKKNILFPLGMSKTVLEADPSGVFIGSSFIYSTARGYAKLGQLYIDNGISLDGNRIATKDWISKTVDSNDAKNENAYGFQMWLNSGNSSGLRWPSLPKNTFAAKGNKGQYIVIIPEKKMVIVRLGWSKSDYPIDDFIANLLQKNQ